MFLSTNLLNRRLPLAALLASSVLSFAPAKAAIDPYVGETAFTALLPVGGYITEDFSSLPSGEQSGLSVSFDSYPGSSVSFTVSTVEAEGNGLWLNDSDLTGGPWLGTLAQNYSLTIDFGTGVLGVGAFFSLTDISDAAMDGTLSISINGGAPIDLLSVSSGTQPYLGWWATEEDLIRTLEISTTEPERYVSFSKLTVAPVPEPSTYVMLGGCAAAALVMMKSRRRLAAAPASRRR